MKLFTSGSHTTTKKITDAVTLSEDDLIDELVRRQLSNPFPMEVFPESIHDWIQFLTVNIQLEPCFVGLSLLEAVSISIGSGLRGKMGMMVEKCVLFGCLVGYTSSGKTFALEQCMRPIQKKQAEIDALNAGDELDDEPVGAKTDGNRWVETKDETKALYVKDATFDAFVQLLSNNPKGVTRYYDEFYSYFVDIERLKVNAGDITFWTEKWNSNAEHRIKRKSKKTFTIPSDTLFCNLFGGTQPDFLKYFFTKGKLEQGFSWRFLYAIQPKYHIAEVDPYMEFPEEVYKVYENMIFKIFKRFEVYEHGRKPETIAFDRLGVDYYENWRKRARAKVDACDDVLIKNAKAGIYGKMKQYVVRFATILQVMHECSRYGEPNIHRIEAKYVLYATKLADYFLQSNFLAYQIVYENLIVPPDVKRLALILKKNHWNQTATAEELNISRMTLSRYLKKYSAMYPSVFETRNE